MGWSVSALAIELPAHAKTEVERFLIEQLEIKDPSRFSLSDEMRNRLAKMPQASRARIVELFSQNSAKALGAIFAALGRTEYNNVLATGPAGSGKTFLLDQITLLFSEGIYPDSLKPLLGIHGDSSRFQANRDAFLGHTDVVLVNLELLAQDNTKKGQAANKEETRMQRVLGELFDAAKREFNRTDAGGRRIGRRTLFVFDEVATLPKLVQEALKKILDPTGFHDPNDPAASAKDPGYAVLAMTTPDEARQMINGDAAVERRYVRVELAEPAEAEAFRIVRAKTDLEWTPLYGFQVSDEAIRFLIRMRKFLDTPPLAMPGSVLKGMNDLILAQLPNPSADGEITLKDAQRFLMEKAGLSEIWFEGPNGEPPFHDFADQVKKLVAGHDEVIEKIAARLKAWARLGFGGDVPVFFLGGVSGSGKDTLIKAINQTLFGHDGRHLIFSLGGKRGHAIDALFEGPPLGNHVGNKPPLVVEAMKNGKSTGLLVLNEGKDALTEELDRLKVLIERGTIRPQGEDPREIPLRYPIFILGQWGEELFEGKTDDEVREILGGLSQAQIEQAFLAGKNAELGIGGVSRAMLDRAKKTGGVFLFGPVPTALFPKIVRIALGKVVERIKVSNNMDVSVSDAIVDFVAKVAAETGAGPRALEAVLSDFTETAISEAQDQGLPLRDAAVAVDFEPGAPHRIVVKSGGREWKLEAHRLLRTKISGCELKLLGLDAQ